MKKYILISIFIFSCNGQAHISSTPNGNTAILADLTMLKKSNVPVLYADETLNLGYAVATGPMLQRLSHLAHQNGRCGNFEALDKIPSNLNEIEKSFNEIKQIKNNNLKYILLAKPNSNLPENTAITESLNELKSENLKETVQWLSAYPTRYNRGTDANKHVIDFSEKLKKLAATANYPITVDLINHRNTPQKSIRVSIKGATRPNEIIVLGGHLDSIHGWMGTGPAPGADDNASGSASLLEALRVLTTKAQPQRSVEFFWYAGEESGLLGSAEIAESYKTEKKNVIAVLQLDMTLFPGDGPMKIASMTDFTSAWLRDYLKSANDTYIKAEVMDDQCGYGCSDHASWFRRGFPALMPTEAKFNSMFQYIHTEKDVLTPQMNFDHALVFSKIALIMALDLGNSANREPIF